MTRSVIRHVDWTIRADDSDDAPPPLYEMRCISCGARSAPEEDGDDAQQWALEHSGRHPTHRTYRGIVTSAWRTTTAEDGLADWPPEAELLERMFGGPGGPDAP